MSAKPVLILSILFALLASACDQAQVQTVAQAGTGVWIDAPRNGSTFPIGPIEVVAHASDQGGIAEVEFSVNGQVVEASPPPDTSATLVTVRFIWQPSAPGEYSLSVRARNQTGNWSIYAGVLVTILGEAATPTPSPMATETVTPEASPSPTSTLEPSPTATSTPTLTPTSTPTATPTFTPTATPTWTPTPSPTPADTTAPSVFITHSPSGTQEPNENQVITFTATATDDVTDTVAQIDIWITPPGESTAQLAQTCFNTSTCIYQGGPYFTQGNLTYQAFAQDYAGNTNSSWPTTIFIWPAPT